MKYFNYFIWFIILLVLLELLGCSSSTTEIRSIAKTSKGIYENDLRINVKQIYAWVNLMPGKKARFHITGSIELLDDSKYDLENVILKKISIIQNKNTIYQFAPNVKEGIEQNKKTFIFSTVQGLLLTSALERENKIKVELLFSDSSNEIIYTIPSVEISEAH